MPATSIARACAMLASISAWKSRQSNGKLRCHCSKPLSSGSRKRPDHILPAGCCMSDNRSLLFLLPLFVIPEGTGNLFVIPEGNLRFYIHDGGRIVRHQFLPCRIHCFDQSDLLRPRPMLEFPFPCDRVVDVLKFFAI